MSLTKLIALTTNSLAVAIIMLLAAGCSDTATRQPTPKNTGDTAKQATKTQDPEEEEGIQAERAKLSPEDRKLADAQEWCVVTEERLGSMGPPIKLPLPQPVFICCKGCQKDAMAHPEKTLAKAEELKKKRAQTSSK